MRIKRNKKYKTIRCDGVEDRRLTWAAKGLHTYLITRPEGWQVQHADLLRRSANKSGVLRGCIALLKQHGYLVITRLRNAQGRFEGWEWTVFEKPQSTRERG
jgi:predicted glycosyltransferase